MKKNMKHNYTYLLEYSDGMLYHGVRSCDCPIKDDNYYGTSKHTPDEIPKKTILTEHSTRKEASNEEIRYHAELDVKNNDLYYNKSNQTSTGFDTTGVQLSPETRQKISGAMKGKKRPLFTPEHKQKLSDAKKGENNPMYGKKHTPEHIQKRADAQSKDYTITDRQGNEFPITNLSKFCRENGLNNGHLTQVARGTRNHHKGYKVRYA